MGSYEVEILRDFIPSFQPPGRGMKVNLISGLLVMNPCAAGISIPTAYK